MTVGVTVPCGNCHLCCRLMTPLLPEKGDDLNTYEHGEWWDIKPDGSRVFRGIVLARKPNGDCHYLGPDGCTIHDRAPWTCRDFDCREIFKHSDRPGRKLAVKRGDMKKEIFDRGRELIEQENDHAARRSK